MLAGLGSLAATGIGAAGSAAANAQAREDLKTDFRDMIARYDRLLNRNYVESPENAGLMRRLQEMQRDRYNQSRATNVVAGGTDAHLAAMQQQGAKIVSDTGNAIAERAQSYKDKVEDAKYAAKHAYAQQMFGLNQQKAQTIANAAGQASKAMAGIAAAGAPAYDVSGGEGGGPGGMFGLAQDYIQRAYENRAQADIDAYTEASVNAQLENSLQETLNDLKKIGY